MPTVNHPRLGEINFPDTMTRDEITAALRKIDAGEVAAPTAGSRAVEQPVSPQEFAPTTSPVMLAGRSIADLPTYGGTLDERLSGMARGAAETVPSIVRFAPAAAAMAFPPAGVAGYAAMGGVGGLSFALADVMERGKVDAGTAGEAFKGAATNVVPMPQSAARGFLGLAGRAGATGAIAGGTQFGAELVGERIAKGEFPNADRVQQLAKDAAVVAGIVGPLSGVGARFKGLADRSREQAERAALYESLGVRGRTLAQIEPSFANTERILATMEGYEDIAQKRASTVSTITGDFYDKLGGVASNSAIKDRLGPLVGLADEAEAAYKAAQERVIAAEAKLAAAQADAGMLPSEAARIRDEASKELLAAISERAKLDFQSANMLGSVVSDTAKANALSLSLEGLHRAVSKRAEDLYGKLSFPSTTEFIPRDALEGVARATLGADADLPEGRAILSVFKAADGAPAALSLDAFRSLRNQLSGSFAGIPEGRMDNAERLASKVYRKLGDTVGDLIASNPADAEAYKAAQSYWREISEARYSNLGRELFNIPIRAADGGEVATSGVKASTVASIADGIVNGNIDALKTFKRFTETIAKYDDNVAALGETVMMQAVRNRFLAKHGDNAVSLIDDLVKASSKDDIRPYVESLGFGTAKDLRDWRAAIRSIDVAKVTPDVLLETLENPRVRQALLNQSGVKGEATKAIAENLLTNTLAQYQAERALGATEKARRTLANAEKLAAQARMESGLFMTKMQEAANNPLARVFAGGYTLTDEAARANGKGTLTHTLMSIRKDDAVRFMRDLEKKDSAFAELVKSRMIADELEKFAATERKAMNASTAFDMDEVVRYFSPVVAKGQETRVGVLREIVGADTFKRIQNWANDFAKVRNEMKRAGFATKDPGEAISQGVGTAVGAARGGSGGGIGEGFFAKQIFRVTREPYYKLSSKLLVDREAYKAFEKTGDLLGYMSTLPVQRAAQIMADRELAPEISRYHQERKQAQSLGR